MDVKVVDPAFFSPLDPSQREAYFFILTEIWRQIADELVAAIRLLGMLKSGIR